MSKADISINSILKLVIDVNYSQGEGEHTGTETLLYSDNQFAFDAAKKEARKNLERYVSRGYVECVIRRLILNTDTMQYEETDHILFHESNQNGIWNDFAVNQ
jgi:hypothetical protein